IRDATVTGVQTCALPISNGVLDELERHRPDPDRLGHRVPERVVPGPVDLLEVVVRAFAAEVIPLHVVAGLERVRAGNVGRRETRSEERRVGKEKWKVWRA